MGRAVEISRQLYAGDSPERDSMGPRYLVDEQVGFLLRVANQRHTAIFSARIGDDLSPMQFALLAKLAELGPQSQNELGRRISTDGATAMGVVARLRRRGLVETTKSRIDSRMLVVDLTPSGHEVYVRNIKRATEISSMTVSMLSESETEVLLLLLGKMAA